MKNWMTVALAAGLAMGVTACDDEETTSGSADMMPGAGGAGGGAGGEGGMGGGAGGEGGAGGMGGGAGGMGGGAGGMGGEGGGMEDPCVTACTTLADCAAQDDYCPAIDPGESRDALYDGCLDSCAAMQALATIVNNFGGDCAQVVPTVNGASPDFAASCEGAGPAPLGADNPPALGAQIDRNGRPAIATALIGTFNGDVDARNTLKDEYNAAGPDAWAGYADEIAGNLAILDSLDTVCGNQLGAGADAMPGRYAVLAGALADDQLYIFSDRGECPEYLGAEAEVLGVLEAGTAGCGGRIPAGDVIDRSYSVLAAGLLAGVGDGVDANDNAFLDGFPFLAAPNAGE